MIYINMVQVITYGFKGWVNGNIMMKMIMITSYILQGFRPHDLFQFHE